MRRAFAALSILLAFVGSAAAQEQPKTAPRAEQAPPIVAVVDVQLVLREAAAAKAVRQTVETRRASFEKELDQQTQELRQAEEELRKQQDQIEPDALSQRKRELERRFGELRRLTDERRTALNQAYSGAMRQVRQEMARALAEIMRERRIDVSMSRTAVLIFDEKLDITKDVLARLDKRLPKAEVRFDQPPPEALQPQN